MSTQTTNYGFTKDDPTEPYDIIKVNTNLDAIDTEIKEKETQIGDKANLVTVTKTNLVAAINEVKEQTNEFANYVVPASRVFHSANQSIPTSAFTSLSFDSERFDTDNIHDITTNNQRLTCKTAGKYAIFGHVSWANSTAGSRFLAIKCSAGGLIAQVQIPASYSSYEMYMSISTLYELKVGDYVTLDVYQNTGSSLSITVNSNQSMEFGMVKVG